MAKTDHLDQLAANWEARGQRAAASGWIHHLGEVLFVLSERRRELPEVVPYLLGLIARDIAFVAIRARGLGATRPWNAASLLTDLFVARRLSRGIVREDFLRDHAISQWGLSLAWSEAVGHPKRHFVTFVKYPIGFQVVLAALWQLGPRDAFWYVVKEGFWSVATLWSVDDLRRHLGGAVVTGQAAARLQAEALERQRQAQAREAMSDLVWRWIHRDGISALGTVAFEAEGRSRAPGTSPTRAAKLLRVARLAVREANALRVRAPINDRSYAVARR